MLVQVPLVVTRIYGDVILFCLGHGAAPGEGDQGQSDWKVMHGLIGKKFSGKLNFDGVFAAFWGSGYSEIHIFLVVHGKAA